MHHLESYNMYNDTPPGIFKRIHHLECYNDTLLGIFKSMHYSGSLKQYTTWNLLRDTELQMFTEMQHLKF